MLSRVLGLTRDIVFARFIGAGAESDAFFVAFKIPNFLRRLFAEGAFAQAFVPVLSEYRQNGSLEAVRHLIARVSGCLGLALITLTVLCVVGAPMIAAVFAPGFVGDAVRYPLTVDMIRVTFPYLMLISLTGMAGAVLNSYDQFLVPAFTPVLLNVVLISAAVIAAPWFEVPVLALAWGVLVAGFIQLLFQVPFVWRLGLLPRPRMDWQDEGVRRVLALMAPAIFGVSVSQINLMLDTVLASLLPVGSVSWLYYSDRLAELPLGVFAIAIATVILPRLSRQHSAESGDHFARTLDWSVRVVLLIALPSAVALILLARPILFTLFQYGQTSATDILMSSYSLAAYALGLTAFMLIKVLAPGFYARQDTRTPVKYGIAAMVSNMVLNVVCVAPLYYWFHVGHVGLALATSLSSWLNAGLLWRGLVRAKVYRGQPGWASFLLQLLVANVLMALALWVLLGQAPDFTQLSWLQRSLWLGGLCVSGLVVYSAVLLISGLRPRHLRA